MQPYPYLLQLPLFTLLFFRLIKCLHLDNPEKEAETLFHT